MGPGGDDHRTRRRLAGAALVLSPVLTLVATAIAPANEDDAARQLAVVLRHQGRWYLSDLLVLLSLAALVPAVVGLMLPLRERRARLGHLGGGLALTGIVCVAVVSGLGFVEWQMVQGSGGSHLGQMTALLDRVESASAIAPVLLGAGLVTVGLAVLGLGLWRAGAAPAWPALLLGLGAIGIDVGYELTLAPLAIAGAALNLLALAYLGARLATNGLAPATGT
jgi:nitrate reductase NapE component